jgi:hypothetical protein
VHHPDLIVERTVPDEDGEFVAAVFQLPSSRKRIGVVGLHAWSQQGMAAEDRGGARALLRQAINGLTLATDQTVILGDWNSPFLAQDVWSWHCFYALSGSAEPHTQASRATRRGMDRRTSSCVTGEVRRFEPSARSFRQDQKPA